MAVRRGSPTTLAKRRWPLAEMDLLAAQLLTLLSPVCARIEVAGSIRRRVELVGDVELVAAPRIEERQVGLFVEDVERVDLLDEWCRDQVARGVLEDAITEAGRRVFGRRYKRFYLKGRPIDLFVVLPPAQWGVVMALRTGPRWFSRQLVTPRDQGFADDEGRYRRGLLPVASEAYKVKDGSLRRDGVAMWTPEEVDFFEAARTAWVEPEERR